MSDRITYSPAIDTLNTTRLFGRDVIEFNAYVTKLVYPSPKVPWKPNAVILVPLTTFHYGLLASPLIHFPINAPIFFTNPDALNPLTLNEILRLQPTGKNVPAKVIMVGPISSRVENELKNAGLSVVRITGADPASTAAEALEFRHSLPPDPPEMLKNIIVVSSEDHSEGVPAAYFSAHMGVPILFSNKRDLPESTRKKLKKYNNCNVYIFGNQNTIGSVPEKEIRSLVNGKVVRITGNSPYETAVNFAKYHDSESMFGWNMNKPDGWSFSFGVMDNWAENICACILAHLGKHGPLLYVLPERLPMATHEYILSLNPEEKHPPKPPFMHGYILGNFNKISLNTQIALEEALILHGKPAKDHGMHQA